MMKAVFKILLGLFAIFTIGVLSILSDALPGSAISAEQRLSAQLSQTLEENALNWAKLSVNGQKITVTGEAPSKEQHDAVRTLIKNNIILGGVTAVDAKGLTIFEGPPLADPFIWIAERQGGSLVFSGHAPSREARDQIYKIAQRSFGDAEISGELDVASGAPPEAEWLNAASIGLRALARLDEGAIEANGVIFSLSGKAQSAERAASLRELMMLLPENFEGRSNIEAPAPPAKQPPQAATETDDGQPALSASPEKATEEHADACRRRLREIIRRRSIGFASARSALDNASRRQLSELGRALTECPQFTIEIIGHTDSSGRESRNRQLSQYRADAVFAYLTSVGAPERQLAARGVGSSEPITSNATLAGRERNRRIEINLIFDPR